MRILVLTFLVALLFTGCRTDSKPIEPSPTLQAWESKWLEAKTHYKEENYEDAALAFRETLDLMDQHQAPAGEITSAQQECVQALSKAGGFFNSQTLWKGMLEKHPESKPEASRMIARAEKFMRMQGDELVIQGQTDQAEGHLSKAQASINAAIFLYQEAGESEVQATAALKILEEFEAPVNLRVR